MIVGPFRALNRRLFTAVGMRAWVALGVGLWLAQLVVFGLPFPRNSPALVRLDELATQTFAVVRVDVQLDPATALPLADGSALYPIGPAAPQMWAWCATPADRPLEVVGAVLGWVGAHPLSSDIAQGLQTARARHPDAVPNPAVIAVDGCNPGPPGEPAERIQPADEPLQPRPFISVRGARLDREHVTPIGQDRLLIPLIADGAPPGPARAWALCTGALPPRWGPHLRGGVLGYYGSRTLPPDLQQALDDAAASGWVETEPSAPVVRLGRCKQ